MIATFDDTYNFAKKFSHYKDFYIKHNDLIFSKLGLGTFNKEPYKEENYLLKAQPANAGSSDGVIAQFNSNLSALNCSTYYGGSGADAAYSLS